MDDDEFEEFDEIPLDERETALVEQDLSDLAMFESTFRPEGYRGMAVWCQDCAEEHYYPWDMLRENLELLLDTGEIPVHEPAFAPEPDRYLQWDYARGYLDALRDAGVDDRVDLTACPRCGFALEGTGALGNFCARCGAALLPGRIEQVLRKLELPDHDVVAALRAMGLPHA